MVALRPASPNKTGADPSDDSRALAKDLAPTPTELCGANARSFAALHRGVHLAPDDKLGVTTGIVGSGRSGISLADGPQTLDQNAPRAATTSRPAHVFPCFFNMGSYKT